MSVQSGYRSRSLLQRLTEPLFPAVSQRFFVRYDWGWAAFETVLFMVATLVISGWFRPDDPFWLKSQFPWFWLMPALLALRYGSIMGVLAVVVALLGWWVHAWFLHDVADFPRLSFIGGLALVLICGESSDMWGSKLHKIKIINAHLDERLHTLTHNQYLLRLSHERLEQELISRANTLRENLTELRAQIGDALMQGEALPRAQAFMQFLALTCRLERASINVIDEGVINEVPEAVIGNPATLDQQDPLLRHSLETGELCHVQTDSVRLANNASRYVLCAPLRTAQGHTLAVLAVEQLPFTSLTSDNVQLLSVLLAFYADSARQQAIAVPIIAQHAECPFGFAVELGRLHHLFLRANIRSAVVALEVRGHDADALARFEQLKRFRRSADLFWEIEREDKQVLLTLLPLTGEAGIEGYINRVSTSMQQQMGVDFTAAGILVHSALLSKIPPQETLTQLRERCHV